MQTYRRSRFMSVSLVALSTISAPAAAAQDEGWKAFDFSVLRVPTALGFIPMGGNATVQSAQFSTYIGGPALDFATYVRRHRSWLGIDVTDKITLLNVTPFLVGFDWTALGESSNPKTSNFINLFYVRAGPHFSRSLFGLDTWRHGFQLGYAVVVVSEDEDGNITDNLRFLHGLDISYTWTFF